MSLAQIKSALKSIALLPVIEAGFVAFSQGKAVIPPVGELLFENPTGDMHIKYGYLLEDEVYVVKIASGFYDNAKLNLPTGNGLMLLFNRRTGAPLALLQDEGYLTSLRTAAAGAIAAKYLAPKVVKQIGIIGTGCQARLQLEHLKKVVKCQDVMVYGRNLQKLEAFKHNMQPSGFNIKITQSVKEVCANAELIITTTCATTPLLFASQIRPGTHITAIGADTAHKQELEEAIFAMASRVVVDSIAQSKERGEVAHALGKQMIQESKLEELGQVIAQKEASRNQNQITLAVLTGLAVQDIQIAKAVYRHLGR